jgi:hypothetical protein
MHYFYLVMFAVGVLYTFVSFAISGISGVFHFGSDFGHSHFLGHGIGGHGGADLSGHNGDLNNHITHVAHDAGGISNTFISIFSILVNPLAAISFLTVFGGIGIMGTDYFKWYWILVLPIAFISGIAVASFLYKFIAKPLYNSENSSDVSRDDLIATPAEIISPILENGFGEIKYAVNSIRYTAPAKHIDEKAVKQGAKVVICKIENNVFYVTELEEL